MNIINVAKCCLRIINEEYKVGFFQKQKFLNKDHAVQLFENIANGSIVGEQAHRHLGWAQAAMYLMGLRTLDDLKIINKSDGEIDKVEIKNEIVEQTKTSVNLGEQRL